MKFRVYIFIFFILSCGGNIYAQQGISGTILSAKDSTAIFGVSVYFDGTSIGTTTNEDGKFTINKDGALTTSLIISSIGYQQVEISSYNSITQLPIIYLEERLEELDAVIVEDDTWSRNVKMKIFLREFIGNGTQASKCRIKNPDELVLIYHHSSRMLTAYSKNPLLIENKFLGYQVKYDLMDFQVLFQENELSPYYINSIYFEGRSFFSELKEKIKTKYVKNREKTYLGSVLHFMRSLKNTVLDEQGFKIYHKQFQVPAYSPFQLTSEDGLVWVKLLNEKISILYGDLDQSGMETIGEFSIDQFGNHYPARNVLLSGSMAKNRVAGLLPLDYESISKPN